MGLQGSKDPVFLDVLALLLQCWLFSEMLSTQGRLVAASGSTLPFPGGASVLASPLKVLTYIRFWMGLLMGQLRTSRQNKLTGQPRPCAPSLQLLASDTQISNSGLDKGENEHLENKHTVSTLCYQ